MLHWHMYCLDWHCRMMDSLAKCKRRHVVIYLDRRTKGEFARADHAEHADQGGRTSISHKNQLGFTSIQFTSKHCEVTALSLEEILEYRGVEHEF